MNSGAEMLRAVEHVAVDWRGYRPCGELTRVEQCRKGFQRSGQLDAIGVRLSNEACDSGGKFFILRRPGPSRPPEIIVVCLLAGLVPTRHRTR
jgi:hypothetical protein